MDISQFTDIPVYKADSAELDWKYLSLAITWDSTDAETIPTQWAELKYITSQYMENETTSLQQSTT